MSTIIDTLITDRTQADVDRVNELAAKGYAHMVANMTTEMLTDVQLAKEWALKEYVGMTEAELDEWFAGMKGAYNAADLNRVGTALNYLAGRLGPICGKSITWTAKTDWAVTDIATASQAETYRQQIQDIRDALAYPAGTPDAPPQMKRLTYTGANDIERILVLCEDLIVNVAKSFRHTGAAECAAGGLLT